MSLETVYYIIVIISMIVGAFFAFAKLSNKLRTYVDDKSTNLEEKLSMKIDKLNMELSSNVDKVERSAISKRLAEEAAHQEIHRDVSALKSQVSAHNARFGMLESLLTEVRADIKILLTRKDQ